MPAEDKTAADIIDFTLTNQILSAYNNGDYDRYGKTRVSELPTLDGETIIDREGDNFLIPESTANRQIKNLNLPVSLEGIPCNEKNQYVLSHTFLEQVGILLYPLLSYGVLNGGSATSYVDRKKNKAFDERLFALYSQDFQSLHNLYTDQAKGITPAFIQPNGKPGPSFMELKLRSLLIESLKYQLLSESKNPGLNPFFQMTSIQNNEQISQAYKSYSESPLLKPLMEETGINITSPLTGIQPLIAAYTHSSLGKPKRIFLNAYGKDNAPLPLPGGHGQNFYVLKEAYRTLYSRGKRFVSLGNVDNLGYTPDPVSLAILALTGKQAGFDFSFRTPVDIKGGILVLDERGRLNCADIGPAISPEEVLKAEERGIPILFNCATGLFNLEYLINNLDRIIRELPVRFTDQDKDAGKYSQAEQVTWEILGLLDDFIIFAVDKFKRFLASKLLIENFMTSGLKLELFPEETPKEQKIKKMALNLNQGLADRLIRVYGMKQEGGIWVPLKVEELKCL